MASVGPYELLGELGRGGVGVVYEARHPDLPGRRLALKRLSSGALDADGLHRFLREARLLARVRHPGVVQVHEVGSDPSGPWLVEELVEGQTLATALARGPLPPPEAARLVALLARAVAAIHAAGVLHRDLKPENVMLRTSDGHPVLLDFGVAREAEASTFTQSGVLLGTPSYMAPEQARDPRGVDARADVYGLGAILYALLAGRPPFQGPPLQVLTGLLTGSPAWPVTEDRALDAICRRAMARDPAARFPDATGLARALEGWATGATARTARARSVLLLAAVAAGVGAVALLGRTPTQDAATVPDAPRPPLAPPDGPGPLAPQPPLVLPAPRGARPVWRQAQGMGGAYLALLAGPAGPVVLSGAPQDRSVRAWEVQGDALRERARLEVGPVTCMASHPSPRQAWVCSGRRLLRVELVTAGDAWELRAGPPVMLEDDPRQISGLADGGLVVATYDQDAPLVRVEPGSGARTHRAALVGTALASTAAPDGRLFLAVGPRRLIARAGDAEAQSQVVCADGRDLRPRWSQPLPTRPLSLCLLPGEAGLAVGGELGWLGVLDASSGAERRAFRGAVEALPGVLWHAHRGSVTALACDRAGTRLYSVSEGTDLLSDVHELRGWDLASGRELFPAVSLPSRPTALLLGPDERWLVVGDEGLSLWRLER